MHAAYDVNGVIAVVHSLIELPPGWSFGHPVQFRAWMNVYSREGQTIAQDLPLPELTIGHDETHVYIADYGAERRQGEHDRVTILRVAVPNRIVR